MATINKNFQKLSGNYLFSEIARRTKAFSKQNPSVEVMRLGIGNTTEALPQTLIKGLINGVKKLANAKTYTGYGDEQGNIRLRDAFSDWYKKRGVTLKPQEIFISDGAKPDTANIQQIFGAKNIIAVQDPAYPVYVDSNIIFGRENIFYMPCTEKNGFFPDVPNSAKGRSSSGRKVDLIYLCCPNNPTGGIATKAQLKKFVDYAKKHKAIIIFDAAYCEYITDASVPKSIYEIEGAKTCAIEINSFSKSAGFTGVRLGWTVVPIGLSVEDAKPGMLNNMWNRRTTTMFNGASNIAQEGGLAVLSKNGQQECKKIIDYYMENARIIKSATIKLGLKVYGGQNAPYIWLKVPNGMSSWDFFDKLLNETHVVGTPGSGFGPHGEGFLRLSAFGHREDIQKAVKSMKENLKL